MLPRRRFIPITLIVALSLILPIVGLYGSAIAQAQTDEIASRQAPDKDVCPWNNPGKQCTHEPDVVPPGFDITKSAPPIAAAAAQAPPIQCDGDGVSGPRTQVLYVRASNVASRYSAYLASFRQWAAEADMIYYNSAQETGGSRRIRFVHDAGCNLTIPEVVLSATGDDNYDNTVRELKAQGYNRSDRKYMIFMDANVYCGRTNFWIDDQSGPANENNSGPSYGRSDAGCWAGKTVAHEHMHTLGGVQLSAPHTSGDGHCVDAYDVMCQPGGPGYPLQYLCPDPAQSFRFDCNHDDYYSTNPPAGSYLATHWNTANSQFLIGAASPPPSNLLQNGGFELDANNDGRPDSWSLDSRATRSTAPEPVHSGGYAMRLQATTNATFAVYQPVTQLQPGTSYTVGGWVNIPITSDAFTFSLLVQWRTASSGVISTQVVKRYTAATSGWNEATARLTAPAGTAYALVILYPTNLNATIYVDDVVFQR